MSKTGFSNRFPTTFDTATCYLNLGYSVIPVHGKVAAVPWRTYQQRRPAATELQRWFLAPDCGLAIVTGVVSKLIVLDFDDLALFHAFHEQHPDLCQTYTVRTRRGLHLYFRTGQRLQSRKGRGMDLQAEGSYVVAPPSEIDGHTYIALDNRDPRWLTPDQISRIQAFIRDAGPMTAAPSEKRQIPRFSCEIDPSERDIPVCRHPQTRFLTASGLIERYQRRARSLGRNNALFAAACHARDHGVTLVETVTLLTDAHVQQPAPDAHHPETSRQRYLEAVRTIHSAYSRPPRPQTEIKGLPNSAREKLFQMGCTHTVRVVEGLRLAGLQPGQAFTYAQALELLQGKVGQWSIRHALAATTDSGAFIFDRLPPLNTPKSIAYADNHQATGLPIYANGKAEKPTRSRPPTHFFLPDNDTLCARLGVEMTTSDPLAGEDLASAKTTRMAAHRELIRRRPGLYPRRWFARRLGVCVSTIDTYNREIPIHSRPTYYEMPIFWHNLSEIPAHIEVPGAFLEGKDGKRYPAKPAIARQLLAGKSRVVYKRRGPNFYWYEDALPTPELTPTSPTKSSPARVGTFALTGYAPQPSEPPTAFLYTSPSRPLPPSAAAMPLQPPPQRLSPRPEIIQRLVERVYKTIQRLGPDKGRHMSQANIHRLIETYGPTAVEQGLRRLKWYAKQRDLDRPAGFLVVASRMAWRKGQQATQPGAPAPRFRGVRRNRM